MPATVAILFVSVYPFLKGLQLSFTNTNILAIENFKYIGINNYIKILTSDREFWRVLGFTFIYVFGLVIISYIIGLFLASLLNQNIRGRTIFRALLLFPWVIPPVVAAKSWVWILNDQIGFINVSLTKLGLIDKPILFLADPNIAKITVIVTSVWKSFPFMTIVLLAGLQGIPKELYESASIDGATWWQTFLHIKLPLLKPITFVATILLSIWTFNSFENIYLLTAGGPGGATEVLSILTYYTAFFRKNLGYSCAIAGIMMIFLIIMTLIYLRSLRIGKD